MFDPVYASTAATVMTLLLRTATNCYALLRTATHSHGYCRCSSSCIILAIVGGSWEAENYAGRTSAEGSVQSAWREGSNLQQNRSRNYVHSHSKSCPRPKMFSLWAEDRTLPRCFTKGISCTKNTALPRPPVGLLCGFL